MIEDFSNSVYYAEALCFNSFKLTISYADKIVYMDKIVCIGFVPIV